jgi:hypothetical protein
VEQSGRPLLSNSSVITFPLQRIATNESLLGSESLNTDSRDNTQEDNELFEVVTYIQAAWKL